MTEMDKLIEDYDRDSRFILKQMYKWLDPKEIKQSVLYKRLKEQRKHEKSQRKNK